MSDLEIIFNAIEEVGGAVLLFLLFVGIIAAIVFCVLYLLSSIGLYKFLKKNKEDNSWLAFVPLLRSYMFVKVGYDKYDDGKYDYLKYVIIILSVLSLFVIDKNSDLEVIGQIVNLSILGIKVIGAYKIFDKCNKDKSVLRTILFALFGYLTLLVLGDKVKPAHELCKKEEKKEDDDIKEEKETSKKSSEKFCIHCGALLEKGSKFCGTCGKEVK